MDRQLGGGLGDQQLVLLRPPPNTSNSGLTGQLSDLVDIDYETLVLLLGVAGAGASWVLYQAILQQGRRALGGIPGLGLGQGKEGLEAVASFLDSGSNKSN